MPTPRRLIAPVVIALLMLFAIPVSSVASPPRGASQTTSSHATTHETVRETVTWTLPAGQCESIPDSLMVSGAGQRVMHTWTRHLADGTTRVTIKDIVKGPAIDSLGREYRFFYYNLSTQVIPATTPSRTSVDMVDVFRLHSKTHGKRFKGLTVTFDWSWTFPTGGEIWPPDADLVKRSTRGNPFTCDPI